MNEGRIFQAIDAAITAQRLGYNVNPSDCYDAIEYEEQIEKEGDFDG